MGDTLKEQGKLDDAIKAYSTALSIKPDFAEAFNNMGAIFQKQGKAEEAVEAYSAALSIKPDYADAHNNMGVGLQELGQIEEAIEVYKTATSIKPEYAEAFNNMGVAFQELGKLKEAIEAYNTAIAIKPDYAEAFNNLSFLNKYSYTDYNFKRAKELYDSQNLDDDNTCNLNFALAKMYDDVGELKEAFKHLVEGNALRKKLLRYSIKQDELLFMQLKKTQPTLVQSLLKLDTNSTTFTPILIVGMPRSGTSLVEQIISSHSKVTGAGELTYLFKYGEKLAVGNKTINEESISQFREKYLLELSKLANGKHFVTDKMPHNFRFIPLVRAALPEAKIIHIKRDQRATCWSNYKHYFSADGLGYSYSLRDVVNYYKLYEDLMQVWNINYDGHIYNLDYENLTTNQELETKKLVNYLDLDWEEACLSPEENNRGVRTASQQQVRKKVYTGSSEVWRKYEAFLGGAFDNLLT